MVDKLENNNSNHLHETVQNPIPSAPVEKPAKVFRADARIEDLFDEACRCQLSNLRNSRNEVNRNSAMDLFTEANHKVCQTYGQTLPKVFKFAGAALQIASGFVIGGIFVKVEWVNSAKALSKAFSGVGSGFGSIGQVLDEDYVAKRTEYQHIRDLFNRMVQQGDRAAGDTAGHIDTLYRLMQQVESDRHQVKTENVR